MRIATKLNAGVVTVFAMSVLGIHFVLQSTIQPQFDHIESANAQANHERVLESIEALSAKLRSNAQDWGFWDETYEYAQGRDEEQYIATNLKAPTEALDGLAVDALIFRDIKGQVLWGTSINLKTKEEMPDLRDELASNTFKHPYLTLGGDPKASSGLVNTSRGLVLVAVAPILPNDRSLEPVGTVWMVSLLDAAYVQELTGVRFTFEPATEKDAVLSQQPVMSALRDTIKTSSLILDLIGQPLKVLTADTPRDVSKAGAQSIASAMRLLIICAAAVMLALWLFVQMIVVSRIARLEQHFTVVGKDGRLHKTEQEKSDDEIGQLAQAFNSMAEQVNHLRDALADSAYISGMSEWAAGTLHNVRNSLSPINSLAWKVQNIFAEQWIANVRSAVTQLGSPDTPSDRREKLSKFLLNSSDRIVESAEKMKTISSEIVAASRGIKEMIAGYEKFSQRETKLEPIDLLPLVQDVARGAVSDQNLSIQVSLPSRSAKFMGNRTILRQILLNLFWNAIDAMTDRADGRKIDIDLNVETSGKLRLSIKDNGEGIARDRLKSIFERGFSTRKNRHGGLGLHWCANAAKALGGTLRAESQGPGTGATLVLCLPSSEAAINEAA